MTELHDWETDEREFKDCVKAWVKSHGWSRDRASSEMRVPIDTLHNWASGKRRPAPEMMVRRLMNLIDRVTA